jgi:hypothetical protein
VRARLQPRETETLSTRLGEQLVTFIGTLCRLRTLLESWYRPSLLLLNQLQTSVLHGKFVLLVGPIKHEGLHCVGPHVLSKTASLF